MCCLVLEAGSPRSGCQQGWVRALVWVRLLAVSSHGRGGERALRGLPQGHQSHSWRFHPQDLIISKGPPPNSITFRIRLNLWILGGHRHSDHSIILQKMDRLSRKDKAQVQIFWISHLSREHMWQGGNLMAVYVHTQKNISHSWCFWDTATPCTESCY